jgi:recombination protein RecR
MELETKLDKLVKEISILPGIGPKSSERIALFILSLSEDEIYEFISSITDARSKIHLCPVCFNITDNEKACNICINPSRDHSKVCVVEEVRDLFAIERSGEYRGLYHVLHGRIDPMNHMSPENLRIKELIERIKSGDINEVIVATNPNFNGDITAMYISKLLKPFGVKITRIAMGLPKGTEIDFVDSVTLSLAIKDRKDF